MSELFVTNSEAFVASSLPSSSKSSQWLFDIVPEEGSSYAGSVRRKPFTQDFNLKRLSKKVTSEPLVLVKPKEVFVRVPFRSAARPPARRGEVSRRRVSKYSQMVNISIHKTPRRYCTKTSTGGVKVMKKECYLSEKENEKDDATTAKKTPLHDSSISFPLSPLSPIIPIDRKTPSARSSHPASQAEHQELLTKYFYMKRTVKTLMDKFKRDQKNIALLEYSRQTNEASSSADFVPQNEGRLLGSEDDKLEMSTRTPVKLNQGEIANKMAAVISDQALRPVVFKIPNESPPDAMFQMMERLSKSGKRCEACGKRMERKLAGALQP